MLIMLLSAWPATLVLDRGWIASTAPQVCTGLIFETDAGHVEAWATDEPGARPDPRVMAHTHLTGGFTYTLQTRLYGWPFISRVQHASARLDVEMFVPARRSIQNAPLDDVSPRTAAITASLAELDVEVAGDTLPINQLRLGAFGANGVVLSLAGPPLSWLVFSVLRVGVRVTTRNREAGRQHRRHKGLCQTCGYDLRGNPFGAQCPECGTLAS